LSAPAGPPTAEDVRAASRRLAGHARVTPLLESDRLNEALGGRLLVKAENLQRTGSFKFRGAFNLMSQLSTGELAKGVVAYSSGNHAQGVAAAAHLLGTRAAIVMPADAPAVKIAGTRAWGAEVITYDRATQPREEVAGEVLMQRGAVLVKPFDDPRIIAGQGTAGLEIATQCAELAVAPDAVLVPCSGGGLSSGIATALAADAPGAQVYAVEPAGYDDTARSLAVGERVTNPGTPPSICDALFVPTPGEITFPINKCLLAGGLAVTDDEVRAAMLAAFTHLKVVAEPGGAVGLAAALTGKIVTEGRVTVAVISGGNVDAALFRDVLKAAENHDTDRR
jgi:threonine dehydratase